MRPGWTGRIGETLECISPDELDALGVTVKRIRRQMFASRATGVPADLAMYRLKTRRDLPVEDDGDDLEAQA